MNTQKAKKAIQKMARQHDVSEDEMRREIKAYIAEAWNSKDPATQAYWRSFPSKGEYPTPEEAIAYLSQQVKKKP